MHPFRIWLEDQKRRQRAQVRLMDAGDPLAFMISQATSLESEIRKIRYVDIQYPGLAMVDTSASAWAKSITYFSEDMTGEVGWFSNMAQSVPYSDVFRTKHEVRVEMLAAGYKYNLEEINQAMMVPGESLSNRRAMAAKRKVEEFIDNLFLMGDTTKGWLGLLNQAGAIVNRTDVAGNNANARLWSGKDDEAILMDINTLLNGVYEESDTVELADTLLLPPEAWALLSYKRLTDSSMTLLQWVRTANSYTAKTNQPLNIREVVPLKRMGSGGTGRMVAYRNAPDVVRFHMPMPHTFFPVRQINVMEYEVAGICRVGGLEVMLPKAMRYADGMTAAP